MRRYIVVVVLLLAATVCVLARGNASARDQKVTHTCGLNDREFLTRGGVFSNDLIDAYIALKMEEVTRFRMTTHPVEYDMYYSL